jgi:hypothetical protein
MATFKSLAQTHTHKLSHTTHSKTCVCVCVCGSASCGTQRSLFRDTLKQLGRVATKGVARGLRLGLIGD